MSTHCPGKEVESLDDDHSSIQPIVVPSTKKTPKWAHHNPQVEFPETPTNEL